MYGSIKIESGNQGLFSRFAAQNSLISGIYLYHNRGEEVELFTFYFSNIGKKTLRKTGSGLYVVVVPVTEKTTPGIFTETAFKVKLSEHFLPGIKRTCLPRHC
jgi:hypothetical protein